MRSAETLLAEQRAPSYSQSIRTRRRDRASSRRMQSHLEDPPIQSLNKSPEPGSVARSSRSRAAVPTERTPVPTERSTPRTDLRRPAAGRTTSWSTYALSDLRRAFVPGELRAASARSRLRLQATAPRACGSRPRVTSPHRRPTGIEAPSCIGRTCPAIGRRSSIALPREEGLADRSISPPQPEREEHAILDRHRAHLFDALRARRLRRSTRSLPLPAQGQPHFWSLEILVRVHRRFESTRVAPLKS